MQIQSCDKSTHRPLIATKAIIVIKAGPCVQCSRLVMSSPRLQHYAGLAQKISVFILFSLHERSFGAVELD
jgi:hypothetical protein